MTKVEVISVLEKEGKNEAYIIKYEEGRIYKGEITRIFEEDEAFEIKELVPFGVKYVLKFQDVLDIKKDPLGGAKEFIEGMTI